MRGGFFERVASALTSENRPPVLIQITGAEGIAARNPSYQKREIPAGLFPGSTPQPKDNLNTITVPVRLEATLSLPEKTASRLAKGLFVMRRRMQSDTPISSAMEKPDTDKGAAALVHPGAAAYYDNTEKSFMGMYGDWLYIGAMGLSGLASAIAAMFGVLCARTRTAALGLIDQLIEVKQTVYSTMDSARLTELEDQIKYLSTKGLHFAHDHNFDSAGIAALRLAVDEARRAINNRRRTLALA